MPEHYDHISALDFLQSAELTARLRRRLLSSPGVIDIQDIFKLYARLTEWTTHARLLLDDLLTRHSIDDGSAAQNLPLVTQHPWVLNLDTYLKSSNSFSSTTNNSYSATTNEFVSQAGWATGNVSKHEVTREVKTAQLDSASSTRIGGRFRVRRKPGGLTTEMVAAVARELQSHRVSESPIEKDPAAKTGAADLSTKSDIRTTPAKNAASMVATTNDLPLAARRDRSYSAEPEPRTPEAAQTLTHNAVSTPGQEEKGPTAATVSAQLTTSGETKTARAKNATSTVTAPADLPLASRLQAPLPVQRELSSQNLNTRPTGSKDRTSGDRLQPGQREPSWSKSIHAKPIFSPLNQRSEITNLTLSNSPEVLRQRTDRSWLALRHEQTISGHDQKQPLDFFARGNADHRPTAAPARSLTTVNQVSLPFQTGQRRADFIWLRNRIDRTAREMISALSDSHSRQTGQRAAGAISAMQSPQNSQLVVPESAISASERDDSAEISAERILRSISNTLMVERERRGY
jgi:hypothetical protein